MDGLRSRLVRSHKRRLDVLSLSHLAARQRQQHIHAGMPVDEMEHRPESFRDDGQSYYLDTAHSSDSDILPSVSASDFPSVSPMVDVFYYWVY